jgi:sodium transport system permease protein
MKILELLQQLVWILEKELRYALRDTDVLIYAVLVPLLIYPGTLLVTSEVLLWQVGEAQRNLRVFIKDPQRLPPHLYTVLVNIKGIKVTPSGNPDRDLQAGKLDAIVEAEQGKSTYDFVTYVCGKKGMLAANRINDALVTAQSLVRQEAYKKSRVPADLLKVCSVHENRLVPFTATETKVESRAPIGLLTTLLFGFIQIGLSAGVAAVCVFAEEKEKKTFETTLSIPVPSSLLTAGKWLTASALALASGTINIIAMSAAGAVVCLQAQSMQKQNLWAVVLYVLSADAWTYGLAVLVFLLCALLSSAVCLLFVSACRTFKDGQAIVTYPMILIMTLPVLSFVPGIEQNQWMYLVPFTNLLLCLKHPQSNYLSLALALVQTVAVCLFSLWLSGKVFFSEKAVLSFSGGQPQQRPHQQKDSLTC